MAVTRPTDLTVAKNQIAAETVAAYIWQLTADGPTGGPVLASAWRLLRGFAEELVELHNLDASTVTPATTEHTPAVAPEHAMNGQG